MSTHIKKIFIPHKVKALRKSVFDYCGNLEQITFAENSELETIEEC